ncbi:MAG: flagellar M-ring protein FliF [Psychrosphaera sp.]|nr:flagellar M-ring protein FliF [Psychrosphaera sp.]
MAEASASTEVSVAGSDMIDDTGSQEQKSGFLGGFGGIDVLRQATLILALVICVGIAFSIILWAKEPDMRPLAAKLTDQELIETMDFLDLQKVDYKLEGKTLNIPAEDYNRIKLLMMRQGLEQGSSASASGIDIIMKDMGFGVSQRMERARLKLSLETQIASTLEQLTNITKAQVLLAVPREQIFARKAKRPSATVVVTLKRGRSMSAEEIDSVVDITASAVQGLEPNRVTVTDQNGRLLNSGSQSSLSARARKQYEVELKREEEYINKIDSILIPIVGLGSYTAQVDVTMDFSRLEETQKSYNPDLPAIRAEHLTENSNVGGLAVGIPGALSNQPPMNSNIPENAVGANAKESVLPGSTHRQSTRNYELDTTVTHRTSQVGIIQRLTVSVALDYLDQLDANGDTILVPRAEAELLNIRRLLQGSIGFDIQRGDTVEVVAIPFKKEPVAVKLDVPVYEQPWFMKIARLFAAALVIIVLIWVVIRPITKKLIYPEDTHDDFEEDSFSSGLDLGDDTLDMLSNEFDAGAVGLSPDGTLQLPDFVISKCCANVAEAAISDAAPRVPSH